MWIVGLALNRPYTFIVAAILILVLGLTSIATTPTDAALTGSKMIETPLHTLYGNRT